MGAASSPLLLTFAFHRITQLILCHVSCPASSSHPSTRSCRIPCYRLFQCAQHHDPPDAYSGLSPTPCQLRASRPSTVSHHPQLAMSFSRAQHHPSRCLLSPPPCQLRASCPSTGHLHLLTSSYGYFSCFSRHLYQQVGIHTRNDGTITTPRSSDTPRSLHPQRPASLSSSYDHSHSTFSAISHH
ncbi:hypothetical protein BC826DRAFT_261145 [Russula brevipes]|nr:hypothetical protein BC826DRAFT_261145 [Russula brevipes]